ncbi:MAG TPA: trehalose-phosphatase [Anaerolineales bacterium]|nr:trehalose-phosphatase [Anaerolineales bacterium]
MTPLVDNEFSAHLRQSLADGQMLWLFLDYDGTLADFAPTPDDILPDENVIDLLARLAQHASIRVAVVSGRRLSHIQELLPVDGILLAGTYGIEIQTQEGEQIDQVDTALIRPVLDALKPYWEEILADREGFYLEDKGWALAIHAKDAEDEVAEQVLGQAKQLVDENLTTEHFRLLGGHKFLEIGPSIANKGENVAYLLERYPLPGAFLIYIGDDDKDEEAFGVVQARGGLAIKVAAHEVETGADYRLPSPSAVRRFLRGLIAAPERHAG